MSTAACPVKPTVAKLREMWDEFRDVPINEEDEIEESFYSWESGTDRFEIWHWFDEQLPNGLGPDGFI